MKTIMQALKDEVHYKLSNGFFENRLIERELCADDECTVETLKSNPFRGAVADCLISLIQAPNFSEGDVSFSQTDKDKILAIANSYYRSIGEEEKVIEIEPQPIVYIGR